MNTLIFLRLSILKEDFKNEPQKRQCSHFTSVIALQSAYAAWKGHTVKYDPGETLPPGVYCNPRNKGETFQCCCFSKNLSSGSGGYLTLRHRLQMWAFTVTSTGLAPSTSCWSRRGERLNLWWYHYRGKTERSARKTDMCWLAWISHNSQALTARCFCPGSFCVAYCSSGIPSEWLRLAFFPEGALTCHLFKPHHVPGRGQRVGLNLSVIYQWKK